MKPRHVVNSILVAWICCAPFLGKAQIGAPSGGAQRKWPSAVHFIDPSNPYFEKLLLQHFGIAPGISKYDEIRKTSSLMVNDTPRVVRAAAVKWVIVSQDGSVKTTFTWFFPSAESETSAKTSIATLTPGQFAFVSPLTFLIEADGTAREGELSDLAAAYSVPSTLIPLLQAKAIHASVDGAVFGNNVFLGANQSHLAEMYTCEENGAILEAEKVRQLVNERVGTDVLSSALNEDFEIGLHAPEDADGGACEAGRGREAVRLRRLLQSRGIRSLSEVVEKISVRSLVELKLNPPPPDGKISGISIFRKHP